MWILLFTSGDLPFLLFPALLFVYYLACWALVGKNPKIENVAPRYEPPIGISPGLARYILTGGSDGTTLAAVLSQLAVTGAVSIQPQRGVYRLELLRESASLSPEEAALIEALFNKGGAANASVNPEARVASELREAIKNIPVQQLASHGLAVAAELAAEPRRITVLDPKSALQVKLAVDAIQETFRKSREGVYFRWNFIYVFAGMAATFLFGLGGSFFVDSPRALSPFLTLWLLLFTSIAGAVMAFARSARPAQPTIGQRLIVIVVPALFFALPGFLLGKLAMPSAQFFVLALLLSVALNSAFMVLMRAPTAVGQKALQELAGFWEFLVRAEQDQLQRMNSPDEKARTMNRFLPYAIALGVRESWGDTMAAAFSNAIVER